jgi:hypothetical protein
MRENRPSGSEGGEAEANRPSLPLSLTACADFKDYFPFAPVLRQYSRVIVPT